MKSKEIVNDYDQSDLSRAYSFYIINKCSFSGLTESSSFSAQASNSNFSMRGIEKLPGYSEIIKTGKLLIYEQLLTDNKSFTYLIPPTITKGDMHKRFDHDQFAQGL